MTPFEPVTIAIVAYNAQTELGETIWSVRRQTYPHFEVFVVDCGSTDGTASVAQQHVDADARVSLIQGTACDLIGGRNLALARASSDHFATLDPDCLWHPEMLEQQIATMRAGRKRIVLAYTWTAFLDDQHCIISTAEPSQEGDVIAHMCRGSPIHSAGAALFRTSVLREVGGWDESLGPCSADYNTFFALAQRGEFALSRSYLLGYRQNVACCDSDLRRRMSSHEIVVDRFASLHAEHGKAFQAGQDQLIVQLFHRAVVSRHWDCADYFLRLAWASDRRCTRGLVLKILFEAGRSTLPSRLRKLLMMPSTCGLQRGTRYL